jgi:hypothetical protein
MYRRVALALVLLAGCYDAPVETPPNHVFQNTPIPIPQNQLNQVDVLFLVDNSSSMEPMQAELQSRFSQFLQVFQDLATNGRYVDLHIGVVTSDYGAGASGAPGCDKGGGGQGGRLQTLPAKNATAPTGCLAPMGNNFIAYNFDPASGPANNLPTGQDLVKTFTCMASVGAGGCGFEHQLESVYAALHDQQNNAGFLRTNAILAVVFVTNEDDGSAPADTDIWDLTKTQYGAESTYRQTRFGVACGDPLALTPYDSSHGPLSGCEAAPDGPDGAGPGRELDVSRYMNFFNLPHLQGGVKVDPLHQLILVGIDGPVPDAGPEIVLSTGYNPQKGIIDYPLDCAQLDPNASPPCLPWLQHSCHAGNFFGDPAIRLNTVIDSAHTHAVSSICDGDWTQALVQVANMIVIGLPDGCIKAQLADPMNPDCVVEDHTVNPADGSETVTEIPPCAQAPSAPACWRVETKPGCAMKSPQGVGVTIDRHGADAPPDTTSLVSCNTVAQ